MHIRFIEVKKECLKLQFMYFLVFHRVPTIVPVVTSEEEDVEIENEIEETEEIAEVSDKSYQQSLQGNNR